MKANIGIWAAAIMLAGTFGTPTTPNQGLPMPAQDLLDQDTPDTIRVTEQQARDIGESALRRIGYSADDAAIVVDQLVDNALCGYRFASLPRILTIAADQRTYKDRAPVRVVRETPVSALVDGGNQVGYIAAFRGAEIAAAKAKASGIAMVGVYNSFYSGRNAFLVCISSILSRACSWSR